MCSSTFGMRQIGMKAYAIITFHDIDSAMAFGWGLHVHGILWIWPDANTTIIGFSYCKKFLSKTRSFKNHSDGRILIRLLYYIVC